jgi:Spy/CpxP family protein refolding chaperone
VFPTVRMMQRVPIEELGKLRVVVGNMLSDEKRSSARTQHAPNLTKPLVKVAEVVEDLAAEHEINAMTTQRKSLTRRHNAFDAARADVGLPHQRPNRADSDLRTRVGI